LERNKFDRTARRCRTIGIEAGDDLIISEDPLPVDLHDAIRVMHARGVAH